ncbi:MAG: hypothetical protein ACLQQ4_14635 [Bacteroidia bacterium]
MVPEKSFHNSYYFLTAPSKENYVLFLSQVYYKPMEHLTADEKAKLIKENVSLIIKGLPFIGIDSKIFFNTREFNRLRLFAIKLKDNLRHRDSEKSVQAIFSAYNSYLNFVCRCYNLPGHRDFFSK